jgi:hypothetical protein
MKVNWPGWKEKIKYFIMPSAVVSAIHYDTASTTLRVIFVSGMIYDYKNVPEKIYKAMKTSGSKGSYLNQHIKGHYEFIKIK